MAKWLRRTPFLWPKTQSLSHGRDVGYDFGIAMSNWGNDRSVPHGEPNECHAAFLNQKHRSGSVSETEYPAIVDTEPPPRSDTGIPGRGPEQSQGLVGGL